ncbi:alcohol dehydrogenase AdhP [Photobacterium phosphoreum]|uniref:alcohol dehydrogenase AdhP n=1 Tax=Photobacterium phosphoreum TaxID=659 RepID=UPI000D17CAEA|nr:alcohol dehydrogenase AdhP [Photobacterium phosphoreum]PTB30932.1 alcohol dehydrogenase AdhP [Photobacterium phosphoreum]
MKAAVAHEFKKKLVIEDVKIPSIGVNDVLVNIKACGVCHTDIHACQGDWPVKPKMPLIPGHEGVGIVTKVGENVDHVKIGDRVGVPFLYTACGYCDYCLEGKETLCPDCLYTGYHVDGGYADYCKADARYIVKIPDELGFIEAAPLFCAGVTSYKALKVSQAKPGNWVAIVGVGGLGHLAIQYAVAMGLNVVAVDTGENKKELSLRLGAKYFIDFKVDTPEIKIKELLGTGVHAAICLAVSKAGFESAYASVRRGGTLVLVGLPPEDMPVPIFDTVINGITLVGSIVGTRRDLAECLDFAAQGKIKTNIEVRKLEEINTIFDELEKGEVTGRIVMDYE